MILEQKIEIKISNKVRKHYRQYFKDINSGDIIEISPLQLPNGSNKKIKVRCSVCDIEKEVFYYDYNKITKNNTELYYCKDCKNEKTKKTLNKLYGEDIDNVFQLASVKEKSKKTCKEKYGVEHHLQNKEILAKLKATNKKKYGVEFIPELKRHTKTSFIKKCKKIHGNLYDYSKVKYERVVDKIIIICKKHGEFIQIADDHVKGCGCPKCKTSKGENEIIKYLDSKSIKYVHQKKFEGCKYRTKLPFDFYLLDYNMCIEYDGIQHSEMVEYFGGEEAFELRKKKDRIKTQFCRENKIILERITHSDNIIDRLEIIL